MRITIDLPSESHRILASLAMARRERMSQTAADLLQQGLRLHEPRAAAVPALRQSRRTGLPQVELQRVVTSEDVRALADKA